MPMYEGVSNLTQAYSQYFSSLPTGGPELETIGYPDYSCAHVGMQECLI